MKNYKFTEMSFMIIGYGMLSIAFFALNGNFTSVWLGINVGLAIVPMIIITYIYKWMSEREFAYDWVSIILLIIFVFFFPNSFYVITDMIHIDSGDFYSSGMYEPTVYHRDIEEYLFLFHLVITIFIGCYAGVKSLLRLEDIFKKKNYTDATRITLVFVLIFLSAIAIYIGRFLRFFSWDILRPFTLMRELLGSLDLFALMFIGLFTLIQLTIYYGYRILFEKEPF